MSRNRTSLALLLSLFIVVALYVMGCGDYESPLASSSSSTRVQDHLPPLDGVNVLARAEHGSGFELMPGDDSLFVSETIDHNGGTVTLQNIVIDVKKKAIPEDEEIEVSIMIPNPSIMIFDLGPDGYHFEKKIMVKIYLDDIDLGGIDPNDIEYVYYDEELEEWIPQGGKYISKDNMIEVKVDHFSYWALASE